MPIDKDLLKFHLSNNTADRNAPIETFPDVPSSRGPITPGSSKYDTGLSLDAVSNIDAIRAGRQTWYNQFSSMLGRGVTKGIVSLGYTPALFADMFTLNKTAEDFDNSMVKALDETMKSVDEAMPEYSRYLEGASDFKPWSWDFWMRNGDSVIESAIGFGIPGGVIGGGLTKAGKMFNMSTKLAKTFGATGSAYIMNHTEGMREATELYSNLIEEGLSPEEASKAADEVIWNNKLNLLFEIPQTFMLLRGFKHATKNANIDKSWLRTRGADLGKQALSEGVEEVNTGFFVNEAERTALIDKYNKDLANPKLDYFERVGIKSKLEKLTENDSKFSRYFDYMLSDQGLTEFTLGALGGVGFDVIGTNAANVFAKVKGEPTEEAYKNLAKEQVSNNPEKIRSIFNKSSKIYEDMLGAANNNDEELFNINRDKLLFNLAFNNAEKGTFKQFRDTTESMFDNMTEDEAIANNIDYSEMQSLKESTLSKLDKMESVYNSTQNKYEGYSHEIKNMIFENKLALTYLPDYIKSINDKVENLYNDLTGYSATQLDINRTSNLSKTINGFLANKDVKGDFRTYLEKQKVLVDKMLDSKLDNFNSQFTDSELIDASYYENLPNKKSFKQSDFNIEAVDDNSTDLLAKSLEIGFIHEETKKSYKDLTNPKKLNELQKEVEQKQVEELNEARRKTIEKAKSDFNELIKNTKDLKTLKDSYAEFKKSDGFKTLSQAERSELDKEYQKTISDIKTSKTTVKTEPVVTSETTASNEIITDKEYSDFVDSNKVSDTILTSIANKIKDNKTLTPREIAIFNGNTSKINEILKDIKSNSNTDTPNLSEKDVDKYNDKLQHDRKKESILSLAWLNVLYTKNDKGKLVDLFDENGNLVFEAIRDKDILNHDKVTIGAELEIVIDEDYAKANNIPLDEANMYRIPYGIRFKGSNRIAAYVHALSSSTTDKIDENVSKFIQEDKQQEEQDKLVKFRKELFDKLVKGKTTETKKAEINKRREEELFYVANLLKKEADLVKTLDLEDNTNKENKAHEEKWRVLSLFSKFDEFISKGEKYTIKDGIEVGWRTITNSKGEVVITIERNGGRYELVDTDLELAKDILSTAESKYHDSIKEKEINAKYDLELAALENNNNLQDKLDVAISYVTPGSLAKSKGLDLTSNRLGDDIVFGVINSSSGVVDALSEVDTEIYSEPKSVANYPNGALVALLPSFAKNEGKVQLLPALLYQNTLSEEDVEIVHNIISNYNKYNTKEALNRIGLNDITSADQLIDNIVYNGKNSNNFKVEVKDGKRYFYPTKNKNGAWNEADKIEVSEANSELIKNTLRNLRYNIKKTSYNKLKIDTDGSITVTEKNIPINKWIGEHTQTNIQPYDVLDNNNEFVRKNYFVQPVIEFMTTEKKTVVDAEPVVKSEPTVKKERVPRTPKKDTDWAKPESETVRTPTVPSTENTDFNAEYWLAKISEKNFVISRVPQSLREHYLKALKENPEWGAFGPKDFYIDFLSNLISKGKGNTVFTFEYDVSRGNSPAVAAKISRMASAENRYEALGNEILNSPDEEFKNLMFKVFDALKDNQPKIAFYYGRETTLAKYDSSIHTILINKATIGKAERDLSYVLGHELLHAATVIKLRNKALRDEFRPLYLEAKKVLGNNPDYNLALKNIEEFIAEAFSNPEFKADLKSIKVGKSNWFTKFIDFIKKLFGLQSNNKSLFDLVNVKTRKMLVTDYVADLNPYTDEFTLYDSFMVPGLTVYQTEEMLKSFVHIITQELRYNTSATEQDIEDSIQSSLDNAYNRLLEKNPDSPVLDLFDIIIGENGDYNTDTYKSLRERSDNYINKLSKIIKEDDSEFSDDEEANHVGKETAHGKNAYEINPKDSASSRLKAFLINIPEVRFASTDSQKLVERENMFGMKAIIPYDTIYNSLMDSLANTPTDNVMSELEKLSKYNPIFAKIFKELEGFSNSSDLNKFAIYREFVSNFSKAKWKFITTQFTSLKSKEGYPVNTFRVIKSNQNDSASILVKDWYNKFIHKTNVLSYDNDTDTITVNKAVVDKLKSDFEAIKANARMDDTEKIAMIIGATDPSKGILNKIGIEMSDRIPAYIMETEKTFNNFSAAVNFILTRLTSTATVTDEDTAVERINNNPFLRIAEGNRLEYLANLELKMGNNLYSSMFRNEENKNIYAIFNNTVISKITQDIFNQASVRFNNWKNSNFHKHSWIFKQLESKKLNENNFEVAMFSTLNELGKQNATAKSFKNLTEKDRLLVKVAAFTNQGQETSYFQFPTQSDKTAVPFLKMPRMNVSVTDGRLNSEVLEAFYSTFEQELARINQVKQFYADNQATPENLIENYHVLKGKPGQGHNFLFFPEFNDRTVVEDGNDQPTKLTDLLFNNAIEVKEQILDLINENLLTRIANTNEVLLNNGIVKATGDLHNKFMDVTLARKTDKSLITNNFSAVYTINYALAYQSIYTLYNNDPAFAKNITDALKRGAMNMAPGVDFTNEGNFNILVTEDDMVDSNALTELSEALPKLTTEDVSNKILGALKGINSTDAQAWASLDHYRDMLMGLGRLTSSINDIINKLSKGKEVSSSEVNELLKAGLFENTDKVLQPMKPVFVDDVWDPISNTYVRRYLKYSVFPLFPQLTKDYPTLDKLRTDMQESKTDLTIAVSGVKEGAQLITPLSNINVNRNIELPWSGLKLQQEVPFDKDKLKINTVSQARKLLFGDLLAFEGMTFDVLGNTYDAKTLKTIYDKLFTVSIDEEYDKLYRKLDVQITGGEMTIGNVSLISDLLRDEAVRRQYDANFLQSLSVENNKFVIPLWISTYADQIESLLTSLITNRIVKQKMPGKSFVQGSPYGFSKDNIVSTTDSKVKPFLSGMSIKDGKISSEGILLPNIFKNLMKEGDVLDDSMLQVVGFRIPNQGHNSMANLKIEGFLPEEAGDLVIVSPDMLVRMGSDFDVDKLYLYVKNAKRTYKDGKWMLSPYRYSISDNELVERYNEKYKEYVKEALQNPKFDFKIKDMYNKLKAMSKASISSNKKINYLYTSLVDLNTLLKNSTEEENGEIREQLSEVELELMTELMSTKELESFNDAIKVEVERLGYPSFEEFSSLSLEEQNTKKARQNAIIDIYQEILSKQELAPRIMRPNDLKALEDANNDIQEATGETTGTIDLLSTVDQDKVFESNIVGKSAIGETSLWSTALAQFQYTNLRLNTNQISDEDPTPRNLGVKFLNSENKLISDTVPNKYDIKNKIGLYTLNKVKGLVNNSFISDILQVLQSAATDNAKEQQLHRGHLNEITLKPAMYIAMSGIDSFPIILSFISQSSVKDFVKSVNAKKSLIETPDSVSAEDRAFEEINFKLKDQIIKLGGTITELQKGELPAFSETELLKLLKQSNPANYESLNIEDKVLYLQKQYEVLNAFKYYFDIAKQLGAIINHMNVDTKTIGKNFIEVRSKYENIVKDLKGGGVFLGIEELYDNTVPGTILDKAIEPSTKLFSNPNIYPKFDFIDKAIEQIAGARGKENLSNQELELIKRESNHFLTNSLNGLFSESLASERKRLIQGKDNLANRINTFNQTNNNWLLKKLVIEGSDISYPLSKLEGDETLYAVQALIELLNNDSTKQLGEDLIKYSFLISGNNRTMGGLSNVVPIEYLLEKGFGEFYNSKLFRDTLSDENLASRFIDQFYRNNPTKAFRFPNNNYQVKGKGQLEIRADVMEGYTNEIPKYLYVNVKGKPTLYGVVSFDGAIIKYQALNQLGFKKKGSSKKNEYSMLEDLVSSAYSDNNIYNPFKVEFEIGSKENIKEIGLEVVDNNLSDELPWDTSDDIKPITQQESSNRLEYNPQQQAAIQKVFDFIDNGNPNEYFVIEGKAGTGKTTIAQEIGKKYISRNIKVAAISHKAKFVIQDKFESSGIKAGYHSIAGLLGMTMDLETGKFEKPVNTVGSDIEVPIEVADIIIIDEASMINEQVIDLIFENKYEKAKVIFLGDIGQLPPIRTTDNPYYKDKETLFGKKSPVFKSKNKAELTERVRQGEESPILPFADYFWNNSMTKDPINNPVSKRENIVNDKGALLFANMFNDIKDNVLSAFKKAVETKNPNYIKVVTYRNATRQTINKWLHDSIFGRDSQDFNEGELIIFNSNFKVGKEVIENSTETQVLKSSKISTDADGLNFIKIDIQVGDLMASIPVISLKDKTKYNDLVSRRFKEAFALKGTQEYRSALRDAWDFKNKYANIDYGYAITSHKSQGSTYDIVVVDEKDIMGVGAISNRNKSESIYTALTRARNITYVISPVKVENTSIDINEINNNINSSKSNPIITNNPFGTTSLPTDSDLNNTNTEEEDNNNPCPF